MKHSGKREMKEEAYTPCEHQQLAIPGTKLSQGGHLVATKRYDKSKH